MKNKKIIRNICKCKKCGEILESKTRHNFVMCPCGNFNDGGTDYIRRGGNIKDLEDMSVYKEIEK